MATLQERGGFRVLFYWHGKRLTIPLGKIPRSVAESKKAKIGELVSLLDKNNLALPAGVDILTFLTHDGKPPPANAAVPNADPISLGRLRDAYLKVHEGSLEKSTIDGIKLHFKHLVKTLGEGFPMVELSLTSLQEHADRRKLMKGIGGNVSSPTIKKELVSLRTTWNWANSNGWLKERFPSMRKVRLVKPEEKPHFQTMQEIERQILVGGLTDKQMRDLWDALYLQLHEVQELLEYVKAHALQPWVYPMFCFCAHTGARRSELVRALITDVDMEAGTVLIHEKKRAHDKRTTRRVPLTGFLAGVLKDWLQIHPGGASLFCQLSEVAHSKKRSPTTGHLGEQSRPTTQGDRQSTVTERERAAAGPVTKDEAHDHFKRTLAKSKWAIIRGWHVFRHSFISVCASRGIDQHLVDEWVGHQTEEQRRRYRHLYPSLQKEAIRTVFDAK